MTAHTEQLERERLLKLAEEYRQNGYDVLISPTSEDLPDFLKGYRPDMIVLRGEEAVVIEVKSRPSISSAQYLQDLAKVVEEHPGWRFELVMTNPEDAAYIPNVKGSLPENEIKLQLPVARELAQRHPESALLYAWSLTEATLRLVASHEGISLYSLHKPEPLRFVKELAFEGIISRSEYKLLMNAFQLRNAIAHGFQTTQPTPTSVLELLEVTEQLLNSLNTGDENS